MSTATNKGPWRHRLLVYFFTALFGVLVYWLLGFVMRDIGTWPGPNYHELQKRMQDQKFVAESESLREEIDKAQRSISERRQRQSVLRDSASNSERTMNQLLELQKLTLQKALKPAPEELQALTESQRLFLANQAKYQEMNDEIAQLSAQLAGLQSRDRDVQKGLEAQRPAIQKEHERLYSRHQLKLAAIKLAVLLPLLGLAVWLFLKKRGSLYSSLVYGFGAALLIKVGMVMHEHFPKRYFKYILIVVAIVLVTRVLVYLLRAMAFPKFDWLLKQYRDAYEHFLCPVCNHPIRRGPLKHLFWTRRSISKLRVPPEAAQSGDETCVCPVCATPLFELCPKCQHVRHSLLPACSHCGELKDLKGPATAGRPV